MKWRNWIDSLIYGIFFPSQIPKKINTQTALKMWLVQDFVSLIMIWIGVSATKDVYETKFQTFQAGKRILTISERL